MWCVALASYLREVKKTDNKSFEVAEQIRWRITNECRPIILSNYNESKVDQVSLVSVSCGEQTPSTVWSPGLVILNRQTGKQFIVKLPSEREQK